MKYLLLLFLTAHVAADNRQLQLPEGVVKCDDEDNFGNVMLYTENNPMPFCTNQGTCRSDYADHPEQPCNCPEGYAGPHCEYMEDEVPSCDLTCQNGGTCMVGVISWEELFGEDYFSQTYCMCEDGYHGIYCEHAPAQCGDDLVCLNGGSCVTMFDRGVETHYCDCTSAGNSKRGYAGESCEFPASTMCADGLDQNGRHFCVNGGICKDES